MAARALAPSVPGIPAAPALTLVPAPPLPTDLTPAARLVALRSVSAADFGRKLRVVGQVIRFDVGSGLAVLATPAAPGTPCPTLAVDLSLPLLAVPHTTAPLQAAPGSIPAAPQLPSAGFINRERLRVARGEWLCVVGWLEGAPPGRWAMPPGFADPPARVLEAIHVSMAREPPGPGAVQ